MLKRKGRWRISGKSDKPIKVTRRTIDDYKDDPRNANSGSERGNQMVEDSLNTVGPGRSLATDSTLACAIARHILLSSSLVFLEEREKGKLHGPGYPINDSINAIKPKKKASYCTKDDAERVDLLAFCMRCALNLDRLVRRVRSGSGARRSDGRQG
jgi:hypothetical protein